MDDKKTYTLKPDDVPFATTGLEALVVYADDIRGAMVLGPVAKLNLIQIRIDALSEDIRTVHAATIVFPREKLVDWGNYLIKMAQDNDPEQDQKDNG